MAPHHIHYQYGHRNGKANEDHFGDGIDEFRGVFRLEYSRCETAQRYQNKPFPNHVLSIGSRDSL